MIETCKNCGAPSGQRVFRHKDGKRWCQDWDMVCAQPEYSPRASMIYLNPATQLCSKCGEHAKA